MVVEESIFCLMIVCKLWRDVIIDTPQAWKIIRVIAPYYGKEDIFNWSRRQQCYISGQLSRSKATPLDITLDFGSLPTANDMVGSRITKAFRDLLGDSWVDDFTSNWNSRSMENCKGKYEASCERLVDLVIGEDHMHMNRWHSLHIRLPGQGDLAQRWWSLLNQPMPLLERISIDVEWNEDNTIVAPSSPWSALPAVRQMQLHSSCTLDLLHPCPNLNRLEMHSTESWRGIELLNQFTNLKELYILEPGFQVTASVASIQLPSLIILHLSANTPRDIIKAFRLTVLPKLIIEEIEEPVRRLPRADVFRVTQHMIYLVRERAFEYSYDPFETEYSLEPVNEYNAGIIRRLVALFPQLVMTHTIEIKPQAFVAAKDIVEKLKAKGYLQSLRNVVQITERAE